MPHLLQCVLNHDPNGRFVVEAEDVCHCQFKLRR